ncbi:uncharacterized protein LOC132309627 [Cornus florida]|uniref:uncharacterized protein LOC132309627 n=1 Tax=Cornus florida TaxID=4283 RepID=UPI00289FA41A|nr:uncharacterized protein LOC132309627 [Cornus florida]
MEGVGSRHSRSSTRYGPATVFTGPVRKWKKKWVHVSPSSNNASSHHHHSQTTNGTTTSNGNNGSHLLLYKWTPITQSQNTNNTNANGDKNNTKNDVVDDHSPSSTTEEPPRRKFKYIPIAVLEEQKNEDAENADDETKPSDTEPNAVEPTSKSDGSDEKPDINDVPLEEHQVPNDNPLVRQDLNESTLDLSLGLAHDGDHDADLKTDQTKDG